MKKYKAVKTVLLSFLILCSIIYGYLLYNVIYHANSYSPVKADAIIVLGHSIDENDSKPDDWLVERLEAGLELYNEGYADKIMVTGGKGPNDSIPVADAMAVWFMNSEVDESKILIENRSANTGENFEFSKNIAAENGINSIIIVTNDFHIYRSILIANDYFTEISGYSADIGFSFNKFLAYLKEPLSIIKYESSRWF